MNQTSLALPDYTIEQTHIHIQQLDQVQLNIHKCRLALIKHTHHARKQRNRHSNSSTPHHIYTNMHAKSLSGIARQIHIMPENKETYIQTIQAPTIYTKPCTHKQTHVLYIIFLMAAQSNAYPVTRLSTQLTHPFHRFSFRFCTRIFLAFHVKVKLVEFSY